MARGFSWIIVARGKRRLGGGSADRMPISSSWPQSPASAAAATPSGPAMRLVPCGAHVVFYLDLDGRLSEAMG